MGFIGSALMVLSVVLPRSPAKPRTGGIYAHTTRGIRFYLKTPRLRGLLAVNLAAAAASAMVIVNTVVIVRQVLGLGQGQVAWALAAYGGGSMIAALALPRVLDRVKDRTVMLTGSILLAALLATGAAAFEWVGNESQLWTMLLVLWSLLGLAYSASITPSGRLLRRSSGESDRPAIFAAQFALTLGTRNKAKLRDWMTEVQTGTQRIRAGFPKDWQSGDKTGTGIGASKHTYVDIAYGIPPGRAPVIVTAYFEPESLVAPMDPIALRVLADVGRHAAGIIERPTPATAIVAMPMLALARSGLN